MKEQDGEPVSSSSLISIMHEISKSVYLEEILFGKKDSKERSEIESLIELANRNSTEEMIVHIEEYLAPRMFLVGQNITAADIVVHLKVSGAFRELMDF